jgi:hypothetical protein
MASLYREKISDLDEILSEVFENAAETDTLFDSIFDENLKSIETQRDSETEDNLPPLLDENTFIEESDITYIKIPEKTAPRRRKKLARSLNSEQLEKLPKILKLMLDTIYDPIFEIKKETIVDKILSKYNGNNDRLLLGLENLRNDLDGILGKKKPGRVCKNIKPRVAYGNN